MRIRQSALAAFQPPRWWRSMVFIFWIFFALTSTFNVRGLHAQATSVIGNPFRSAPIIGGTGGLAFPNQTDGGRFGAPPRQHKMATGQPCVDVHGMLRPQIVNPNITEHVLIIANSCSYPISLKACYYQSTTCLKTTIAGYGKRQQTLGFSADKDFRFSYTEDFN